MSDAIELIEKIEKTTPEFWNYVWQDDNPIFNPVEELEIPYNKVFEKYIPYSKGKAIEVGCYPCNIISYISNKFGYFPEGIDFTKKLEETAKKVFEVNGIKKYKVYHNDFLTWKPKEKYELVTSFGFIEHFDYPEMIVKKHIDMLKPNGTLVLEVPNFNGLRYFIAKLTDGKTLKKHNMEVMDTKFYEWIAEKYSLEIKYLDYFGEFEYCWLNYYPNWLQKVIYYPFKILSKILCGYKFNSKFMSSYLLFIARKKK